MIVLKMHAVFGKLDTELTLHDGLNLICLPNEAGKSTWSAFLLAMLYGIDTSEKPSSANQRLPMKERYKPWSGKPMQGRLEIYHNGRYITIERHTQGRIPMGIFSAYDSKSGAPIAELNADNCGKLLCGVEKSVFERTAFIRQLGLPVSHDSALEQRLNSLVTSGEDDVSATELLKQLHEMEVKLSRPSTGRLSRLSAEREQTVEQLQMLHHMQNEAMSLRAQVEQAQQELHHFDTLLAQIEHAKNVKKRLAVQELQDKHAAQELLCSKLSEQVAALPDEATLYLLRGNLEQASSALHTAQLELSFAPNAPQKPQPPLCFSGMELAEAKKKHADDRAAYSLLSHKSAPKKTALMTCLIALLLFGALFFVLPPVALLGAGAALIACIVCAIVYSHQKHDFENSLQQAERILMRYGVERIEDSDRFLLHYEAQMRSFEAGCHAHKAETEARTAQLQRLQGQLEKLLDDIRAFAPNCTDAAQGKEAIAHALHIHMQYLSEKRTLELQNSQLSSMQQLFGGYEAQSADLSALSLDEPKLLYERRATADRLLLLQQKLSEQNGKISATGDPMVLQARLDDYREKILAARQQLTIVELAADALKRADEQVRSRFSPQITAEAGAILSALTEGKYPNMLLKPDMALSVRENEDTLMRPVAAMSCGTADQMYLALRLAMVRRLLSENAPIVLDDALINFDDARTAAAIKLLRDESKHRQIILFTCKEISNVL